MSETIRANGGRSGASGRSGECLTVLDGSAGASTRHRSMTTRSTRREAGHVVARPMEAKGNLEVEHQEQAEVRKVVVEPNVED